TTDAVPPIISGQFLSAPSSRGTSAPLGHLPSDRVPIIGVASAVHALLREPRRVLFNLRQADPAAVLAVLLIIFAISSATYGFVIGTFSGGTQLWAAPVKITAG